MSAEYIMVSVTFSFKEEAERIVSGLLDKKLIACANLIDAVESHFWWQGNKDSAQEVMMIAKTVRSHFDAIVSYVKEHHSYDEPEVIAVPIIAGSQSYIDWIQESVTQ